MPVPPGVHAPGRGVRFSTAAGAARNPRQPAEAMSIEEEGGFPFHRPRQTQFADLTVRSSEDFQGLEAELDNQDLVRAYQRLQETWWPHDGEQQAPQNATDEGPCKPKAELLAALRALGSQQRRTASDVPPGPGLPMPAEVNDEDDDKAGWGQRCSGGKAGARVYLRMPSDRQVQRSPEVQAAEWVHLGPVLAVRGRQLALCEQDTGVHHVPVAHQLAPVSWPPGQHEPAHQPSLGLAAGAQAGVDSNSALLLQVQGHTLVLQLPPAPPATPQLQQCVAMQGQGAPPAGKGSAQGTAHQPQPNQLEGEQGEAAAEDEWGDDEVAFAQDGCQEEVLAVQWDAWDAPLLQWAQRVPPHPACDAYYASALAPLPPGQGPPAVFLLHKAAHPAGSWSGAGRPQKQAADEGGPEPWLGLLDTPGAGGGVGLLGEDMRDARALRQGLPPMRPHLSLCEQLVALMLEQWWSAHVEELVPLVQARMAARAAASASAPPLAQDGPPSPPPPAPPMEPSPPRSSTSPSPGPPSAPVDTASDLGDGPGDMQNASHHPVPEARAPKLQLDWRALMGTHPTHMSLAQGVLTPSGYHLTGSAPQPGPPPVTKALPTAPRAQGGTALLAKPKRRGQATSVPAGGLQPVEEAQPALPSAAAAQAPSTSIWAAALLQPRHATGHSLELKHNKAWRATSLPARLHQPPGSWGVAPAVPEPSMALPRTLPPMEPAHWQPSTSQQQQQGVGTSQSVHWMVNSGDQGSGAQAMEAALAPGGSASVPPLAGQGGASLSNGGTASSSGSGPLTGRGLLSTSAPAAMPSQTATTAAVRVWGMHPPAQAPPAQHAQHVQRTHQLLDSLMLGAGGAVSAGSATPRQATLQPPAAARQPSSSVVSGGGHVGGPVAVGPVAGGLLQLLGPAPLLPPLLRQAQNSQVGAPNSQKHPGSTTVASKQQQQQRSAAMAAFSEALQLGKKGSLSRRASNTASARRP